MSENDCIKTVKYTETQIKEIITTSKEFAEHVRNITKLHIESLNMPNVGKLCDFDFDLENNNFTVNHFFDYKGEVKQCFYVIPMELLWNHY